MAWNEPENNGDEEKKRPDPNDPWGNRAGNKNQGPPDIEELINSFVKKLSGFLGGKGGGQRSSSGGGKGNNISSGLIAGIIVVIGIVWFLAGWYTVDEQERGVVLRLGKAQEAVVLPGLHWNAPLVDEVTKINVTRIYDRNFSNTMLTEDDNIVDITMSVQYIITDARNYYLNVRDPEISLQHAAESAIRHVVGGNEMDDVITTGRAEMAQETQERLQRYLNLYGTGITVSQVNIDQSQTPAQVKAAFDDVIKAREDNESFQNEARAYASQVVPEARGAARRQLEEANAYKSQVIAEAEGEASRFNQLLVEYQRAPEVTRERLYIDALQSVMTSSTKIMMDVEGGGNNMMVLPLDQIMQQRNSPATNGRSDNLNSSDLRSLSNQVIQDIQARQGTTTTRGTR
jgi:modulator of FtsH protease HflK